MQHLTSNNYPIQSPYAGKVPIEIDFIILECTNWCNLACWFCSRPQMERNVGYMDIKFFRKIRPQLAALSLKRYCLHGMGESLTHPELREIAESMRADHPDAHCRIATNATYLNKKCFDKIVGLVNDIVVTIDGVDDQTYAANRINGDYVRVVQNVQEVLEYRQTLGEGLPNFEIRAIDTRQSEQQKKAFVDFWTPQVLDTDPIPYITPLGSFGGQIPGADLRITHCHDLDHLVAILWDGRLSTCCWDSDAKNLMGDLKVNTLQEIFHSDEYYKLRQLNNFRLLQKEKNLLCHTCKKSGW